MSVFPLRQSIQRLARKAGVNISRHEPTTRLTPPRDCDSFTRDLIETVAPYTLTSAERIMALVESVRYVVRAGVPGAIAECGVWRGGSMMVVAHTLLDLGVENRDLFLYDTFTHMPDPGEHDVTHHGVPAQDLLDAAVDSDTYAYLAFDTVKEVLTGTGYPAERFHFVQGMVEDTIPAQAPDVLALCRLDTDWYESTKHELEHLYPRLSRGGVLLIDDYGEFLGARKAVDEHFAVAPVLLQRIDFTGRLVVKT